jgi:hypothetical protein
MTQEGKMGLSRGWPISLIGLAWLAIALWSYCQPAAYHDEWILCIGAAILIVVGLWPSPPSAEKEER